MLLLTVTPAAKTAIDVYNDLNATSSTNNHSSVASLAVGDAISHAQLIEISRFLKEQSKCPSNHGVPVKSEIARLDVLLKGSKIYTAPPKPKPQPSSEYVALMARLRAEEEERAYERMINPPLPAETFSQRFPSAAPAVPVPEEEDELVYADVNRQLALIVNVLVSVIACSIAIWIAARHWSVPQRLALSMSGSGLVAAAEIVIFSGYLRRVKEAKQEERVKPETKEVVETWVIDKNKDNKASQVAESELRNRKPIKGKHR